VSGRGDDGRDESGRDDRDGNHGRARPVGSTVSAPGPGWLTPPRSAVEAELAQAISEGRQREADEVALRRVWSQLSQIPDLVPSRLETSRTERRVRWPFVVAASLGGAVAAAATLLVLSGPPSVRRLGPTAGATAAPAAATAGSPRPELGRSTLVAPATVRTASGETLQLALRGGAEVTVTSESTLVLDKDEQPTVAAGEVRFHVAPQPAGHHFTVRASSYRVVVVGTRFRVRVNGSNAAVGVEEGIVEIWKNTTRVGRLGAGDSWISPPADSSGPRAGGTSPAEASNQTVAETESSGSAPGTALPAPASESKKRGASGGPASAARASNVEGISHRSGAGARGGIGGGRGLRASLSPTGLSAGSGASSAAVGISAGDRTFAPAGFDRAPVTGLSPETPAPGLTSGAPAVTAAPSVAPVPAGPSQGGSTNSAAAPNAASAEIALAAQARAARLAGEPRKALALYRTLAQRGGPTAENAEYEIARVLRDGLHQPADAVAAWRAYRAQHPRGLLRVESDISIIETLLAMSEKSAALAEAQEFVRRFPDGERRGEIGAMAADLLRERGDFRGAVAEYDGALASGRCRRDLAESASFHRAVSVLHDDRDAGIKGLKAYVDSFPSGRFRASAERLLREQTKALAAQGATD